MKLRESFSRFLEYAKAQGLLYAIKRGFSYLAFLAGRKTVPNILDYCGRGPQEDRKISNGKIDVLFFESGVKLFYDRREITSLSGLNTGIHSLGLWTDSTKAEWSLSEKKMQKLTLKVRFKELCIQQIWEVEIESEQKIRWVVTTDFDEKIYIDEIRYVNLIKPCFKSWFCDYRSSDFPRMSEQWQCLCLEDQCAALVGVKFPVQDEQLHSFSIETKGCVALPVIESMPVSSDAYILGFRTKNNRVYAERNRLYFSALITLHESSNAIDEKMEQLRQQDIKNFSIGKMRAQQAERKDPHINRGGEPEVLLLNLPWHEGRKWGVRAGSRWPHLKDESEGNYTPFPFFLAYAAALLKTNNVPAAVFDAIAEKMSGRSFIEKILSMNVTYLVIETSIPSFYNDLKFIEKFSQPGRCIILCGPNAEIYDPGFLERNGSIDFVLYGEFEFTLLELIQAIRNGRDLSEVTGLIYRDKGKVVKNPPRHLSDIDLLPWPDRTMNCMENYWDLPGDIPHPSVQMLASRGCSFGCKFCLWPQVMYGGNHYRTRSLDDVVDEMEYLVREKKFKSVYFDDDTFNIGKERMLEFCNLLKDRGLQTVPWAIMARADLMDEQILREMKSAGLWAVKYGVESPDKDFLADSKKKMDLDKTTQIIKMTKALGIKVHLTFCFGFMRETRDSIKRTMQYAIASDPDSAQFSILTPFPGTALFDELDRAGKILTKDWSQYDGHQSCIFRPELLTPQDLIKAKNEAYHLWAKHKKKKMGLRGTVKKFWNCLHTKGLRYSLNRAHDHVRSFGIMKR